MFDKFDDFNRIHKHYKFKLPESETIDLVEKACHSDNFQGSVTIINYYEFIVNQFIKFNMYV